MLLRKESMADGNKKAIIFNMITYKEIKRRFKSEESKDVAWVVHACIGFMIAVGVILATLIIFI